MTFRRSALKNDRRARIKALWGQGLTLSGIADDLGSTPKAIMTEISNMRAQGIDIPYRRS